MTTYFYEVAIKNSFVSLVSLLNIDLIPRFRTGPGVIPSKVPRETEHLLLVINGRSPSKIKAGKVWLDSLPAFPRLKNVAVVMLGMENCDNSWFHPYLESHGGRVKALFVIYDSPEVDNINVFQWPLGVAT